MPKANEHVDPVLLQNLRARVRLTQTEFAKRLLVHRKTVWRWEQGKSAPSPVHLRQMRTLWGFAFGVKGELK